jgi:hypothetical protein
MEIAECRINAYPDREIISMITLDCMPKINKKTIAVHAK